MSKDIFRENWSSTVTAAQMHRVRRPPDDVDTVSVTETVFDDLLLIAQVASAFLRMFSSPNLDGFQREDELSGEYR